MYLAVHRSRREQVPPREPMKSRVSVCHDPRQMECATLKGMCSVQPCKECVVYNLVRVRRIRPCKEYVYNLEYKPFKEYVYNL